MKIFYIKIFFLMLLIFATKNIFAIHPLDYVDPSIGSYNSRWFYSSFVSVPNGLIAGGPIDSGLGGYEGGGTPVGTKDNGFHQGFVLVKGFQIGEILLLPKCIDDEKFNTKLVKNS